MSAKILSLILSMREDLRAIDFDRPENAPAFRQWLLNHGLHEYPGLKAILLQLAGQQLSTNDPARAPSPFGVNLVCYAFGELGIGEDVRMAGRALLTTEVPTTLVNFKPDYDIPQQDFSMAEHVSDNAPYGINIFCLTAQENARHFLEVGEVWVSTWQTYQSLANICPKPLFHMPMALVLPQVKRFGSKAQARQYFKLPLHPTLFCFSFDLNSSIHRNNPHACVDAFLKAFPPRKYGKNKVGLVIKVHTPKQAHPVWEKLKRLVAADDRIHIIEGTLPKPELLAFYQACDCFLSLHRAEGFGRGIAEALKPGLHVITTGDSGNVNFCQPPHADLVDYTLIPVKKGQYPYARGQVWADPEVTHAARLLKRFVDLREAFVPKTRWPQFLASVVGKQYKNGLAQIRAENPRLF